MWKKQPHTMEMTYSTILCTSYGFYFFPEKWSAHLNYGNYYPLSLHMHFHSWEAVETGGQHGVQTNALMHRGKLILFLEVPFHSEERLCRTVSQESKANGGLTKNTPQTMKVTAVEENVSPVFFLQTDSLAYTPVEGRGDLEIICSCDIKSLSMYKINEKHLTSPPPKQRQLRNSSMPDILFATYRTWEIQEC